MAYLPISPAEEERLEAIEAARQLHELALRDEDLECWDWASSPDSGFEGEAIGWFLCSDD